MPSATAAEPRFDAPTIPSGPARPTRAMRGHVVGTVVDVGADGWIVDYPDNPHGPLAARSTVPIDTNALRRAAHARAEVLLVFERERSNLPIVVGLLTPAACELSSDASRAVPATSSDARPTDAVVDGTRVVFTADQEIVLRCGKASIQLLADGSVRIRGTNVLSRASATNRIRGGTVQIN